MPVACSVSPTAPDDPGRPAHYPRVTVDDGSPWPALDLNDEIARDCCREVIRRRRRWQGTIASPRKFTYGRSRKLATTTDAIGTRSLDGYRTRTTNRVYERDALGNTLRRFLRDKIPPGERDHYRDSIPTADRRGRAHARAHQELRLRGDSARVRSSDPDGG